MSDMMSEARAIGRAEKSARLLQRMSGVLNETSNPGNLISRKGFRRLFLE